MLFIRFKCPKCGELFKILRLLASSETTRTCPKCGEAGIAPIQDDLDRLRIEEKSCSSFG